MVIGTLVALAEGGPELSYARSPQDPKRTRVGASTLPLSAEDLGTSLILGFLDGDLDRPIVLGRLLVAPPAEVGTRVDSDPVVIADGQRLRVEAHQELVLCCGKASITLRANGRVVVRGTYVETRAKGVNRVRGGSVAIN